ncbi:M61 family peptidase [Leadbetterella byssophila]|uniref:M61 family metallopeptidase n=1 Tax=Leadbetterella byssophila TaxID=316068 RepID=UPI0039A099BD
MFDYFFSFDREKHLIYGKILIPSWSESILQLGLPAWRPGRYQLQNFPKNLLNIEATQGNLPVNVKKKDWRTWEFEVQDGGQIEINYIYYAFELNAGSSYVHRDYVYLNPVNFTLFHPSQSEFRIHIESDEKIAGGIAFDKQGNWQTSTFSSLYDWFDSPLLFGPHLKEYPFTASGVPFYLWVQGETDLRMDIVLMDLQRVAEYQIEIFGEFTEPEYHFLLIVPPHSYYHGVEHRKSTVMVLGEHGRLGISSYQDLLGLASHELFHAWNICKIRPKELLPYDYTQACYFDTCFVAEGITTYMGDRTLLDSGVFSREQYRHELETTLRRHFDFSEPAYQSLLTSSFDLWVDGYEQGVPGKKVSVYHKGAIVALMLDVYIRKGSKGSSLETYMKELYNIFGNLSKGYDYKEIIEIAQNQTSIPLASYYEDFVAGTAPIFEACKEALEYFDFRLVRKENTVVLEDILAQENV